MTRHVIVGPPGTGKTYTLTKWVAKAVDRFGLSRVMVLSFTKAAALELASRLEAVDDHMVGTLHAICFRALGRPEVAESHLKEWDERHPMYALRGTKPPGGKLMESAQRLRSLMVPRAKWPAHLAAFQQDWETWMDEEGYVDFTGMVEQALEEIPQAPGGPAVLFGDEMQDCSLLEHALVEQWGRDLEYYVIVGDPQQCLYRFKGASPETFLEGTQEENVKVLTQSYRCPAAVHGVAKAWIDQSYDPWRAEYAPTKEAGYARVDWDSTLDHPTFLLDLDLEQTHMILASCNYQLSTVIGWLRSGAIPFHNPYKPSAAAWNPLRGAAPRLHAWLEGTWTWADAWAWASQCRAKGLLKHGMKAVLEARAKDEPDEEVDPAIWVEEPERTLDWLEAHLSADGVKSLGYAITVVRKHGVIALDARPSVVVGTIHSVKGGEAQHVYLSPDLSRQGYLQWVAGGQDQDDIRRALYVGLTRASVGVTLLRSSTPTQCASTLFDFF